MPEFCHFRPFLLLAVFLGCVLLASAAPPPPASWTVADAPYRALVRLRTLPRTPETGISIELPELGLTRPDMADLLLTDAIGKALPLAKVATSRGGRVQLLARELGRKLPYFLYFGGSQVRNAPSWTPKLSLFMETRRAPAILKYDTCQEVKSAWDAAPAVDGAGFVWSIFHGENPYGESYNFVTHYTGYLPISEDKQITFYTLSSDASFVLVNDRPEFGWPGQHNPVARPNSVRTGTVRCQPPSVKIDYYAVKGPPSTGDRRDQPGMVLGWKGQGNQFANVPGEAWLHPGTTVLAQIEQAHGPALPEPKIVVESMIGYGDQWLYETSFGFVQPAAQLAGWTATWEFEDGAVVDGLEGRRVLVNPEPQLLKVKLTPPALSATAVPVAPISLLARVIFSDRVLRAFIRNPDDVRRYSSLIDADNLAKLKSASVGARLKFLVDWGTDQQIAKFSDAWREQDSIINDPVYGSTWVNARLIAIRTHASIDPAKALSELHALEPRIRQRFPYLTEPLEIDLHVFYLRDADSAARLGQIAFQYPASDLARTAKIRVGDLYRFLGRYKEAIAQYQLLGIKADDRSLPAQDRAYSITINDMLQNGFRSEALAKLNEWEMKHPMAKFDSDFLLLRARTLMFFGRWSEAMLELESFEKVQPESPGQIDAEFLRARVLYERGAKDEARKLWNGIVTSYPKHPLAPEAKAWAAKP